MTLSLAYFLRYPRGMPLHKLAYDWFLAAITWDEIRPNVVTGTGKVHLFLPLSALIDIPKSPLTSLSNLIVVSTNTTGKTPKGFRFLGLSVRLHW